ncbi:efflux RND transporter permease subunit [Echinimonas agarilytica]|uniref:Efflux RND transporter permease subunit n=1 Tax=Echinimonas agarilytica TaxID=1215918 RepID=A0AA42B9J6_9GAMM|nr:efflux RND transporter permease subunit [Echinimonas agarilytica]MCM2681458.1 efflux RND transporter permease subunit [Echinimonas agarilytica]
MWLPNSALRHPQFSMILILLMVVLGIISYSIMPRSEDPQFDLPITLVEAVYPGASPLDVETLVVDPLEAAIGELEDIKKIATSIHNGGSRIEVTFRYGTDPDEGFDDVNRAISSVKAELPIETELFIQKASPTSVNILQFAVWTDPMDYKTVDVASESLQKRLERFPEVRKAERWGLPTQIIEVSVLPSLLKQYGLNMNQVTDALASRAENITPGFVDAEQRRFNVNASGNYKSLQEVRETIVLKGQHSPIQIGDVAHVDYASDEPTYLSYYKEKPVVFLTVQQATGENIFTLTETLLEEVEAFKKIAPKGVHVDLIFKQADSVSDRVNGFFSNLAQGLVLVAILSLLFLGPRASVLITLTVPLSFTIAIGLLDITGFGLEQMSIVGLIIALGLLVDDAIVVTESVHRTRRPGMSAIEAARQGANRIGMASSIGTFTTVFAFLPMLLLQSSSGDFMRSMPITVSLVLIASLVLSLTLTPLLASKLMVTEAPKWSFQNSLNRFAESTYQHWLAPMLRHPFLVLIAGLFVLAGSLSIFPSIGVALFPKAEKPILLVDVEAPPNTALFETDLITQDVAQQLKRSELVHSVALNVGNANPRIYYNEIPRRGHSNYAQILVLLENYDPTEVDELLVDWRSHFGDYSKAKISIKEFQQGPVTDPPITFRLVSDNIDDLVTVSADVEKFMRSLEGTINIRNDIGDPQVEVDLNIRYDLLALTNVPVSAFDQTLKTVLTGNAVGTLKDDQGNDYPVKVKGLTSSFDELVQIDIASEQGALVPINQYIQPRLVAGHPKFYHFQKVRNSKISADAASGYSVAALTTKVIDYLKQYPMPQGMRFEVGGEEESRQENFSGLSHVMMIASLGIFAALVFQFRSVIQPIVIFASIPFAIGGAILGLFITSNSFSIMAFVGLISLFGIVVNNAIILVDTVNYNLAQKMTPHEAVVQASSTRLTPILLTTLTTIVGLIPLTLFGGKLWEPLGWVIIGGLSLSTISSLVILPILTWFVVKGQSSNE